MGHRADAILAKLDEIAAHGNWPSFDGPLGVFEYHAMRMVAVRERGGDEDWGVAFECVFGDFLDPAGDNPRAANVSTFLIVPSDPYGVRRSRGLPLSVDGDLVTGPAGVTRCDADAARRLDLRPGMLCGGCDGAAEDWSAILAIRAYLAEHPGALWSHDVAALFGSPCDVVVASEAFAHVIGDRYPDTDAPPEIRQIAIAPSASTTFRTLAEALATGDASRFVPGESNLDWRRWATIPDESYVGRGAG